MPRSTSPSRDLYALDFHSLSVKDLLDARDQFHVHLAHKPNVFSTAIGLYLIRDEDPDSSHGAGARVTSARRQRAPERTLQNSSVRDESWPCILVFVNKWATIEEMHTRPEEVVPPFVYLTDGRRGSAAWHTAMPDGERAALEQRTAAARRAEAEEWAARMRCHANVAADRLRLSARGYTRALRVARSIADLAGSPAVRRQDVAEALAFRHRMPGRSV